MTGIVELIGNLFGAVKEFLGYQSERSRQRNAEDMKRADVAKSEELEKDRIRENINRGDLDELRKDISE